LNLVLAIAWVAVVPVSIMTGWIYSVAFISAVSIYANFVSHIAGWRADEPVEAEQAGAVVHPAQWDERD
jgi:ABC-type transport system involved in Fe-S cluster assembly fused permease/ATPase subunit